MVQDSTSMLTMSESEGRKRSKPVMEKRRRERINKSLEELKLLVLEARQRDSSRYTRLEKADILEMTVKHLRGIKNRHKPISSSQLLSRTVLSGMHLGCCHCIADSVTSADLITMETCQAASRHPRIAPNPNQYVTPVNYDSNIQQTEPGPHRQSLPTVCNLAHHSTAVQYIPLQRGEMRNSRLPCSESSGVLWRPF